MGDSSGLRRTGDPVFLVYCSRFQKKKDGEPGNLAGLLDGWKTLYQRSRLRFWTTFYISGILISFCRYKILPADPENSYLGIAVAVVDSMGVLLVCSVAVAFFKANTVVTVLLLIIPVSVFFASSLGSFYKSLEIKEAPRARVLFESEKDQVAAVEGHVIFDLDRYLLLLTENKSGGSVVAIPHEKIKSIQTPPIRESKENSAGD